MTEQEALPIARKLIQYLETGELPAGLFAADVFLDFTPPLWRIQARGIADATAIRRKGHPAPGEVSSWRLDPTRRGFVLEVEERWVEDGKRWYCREMLRVDVRDGEIAELSVYCTGDWTAERCEQHSREVQLLRR